MPNTSFFYVIKSLASGSTSYRGEKSHIAAGAYSSHPNTSFFHYIQSLASGSTSYRADKVADAQIGAYTSTPNTSFFFVHKSLGSGSTAYRGAKSHLAAGAYSSHPNTSFFHYIQSLASGSTSYRAERANDPKVGVYTSTPNSTFFLVHKSLGSGSTAYRGAKCADTSSPTSNTSFFIHVYSLASGSKCYRTDNPGCNTDVGAYSVSPNTSFFMVHTSQNASKDSTCYRGFKCRSSAYTASPNTSFFNTIRSKATGSTCYRGESCRTNAGAYVSSPNTKFFDVVVSGASGSNCYRGQNCAWGQGAYASSPNTNFFNTVHSFASGSKCYRATGCVYNPNANIFDTVKSLGTGKTCYRATTCRANTEPDSNKPNTQYFNTTSSESNGVTCPYATGPKCTFSNTTYFTRGSKSTDVTANGNTITAYYVSGCNTSRACESVDPNYFTYTSISARSTENCGHSQTCHIIEGCKYGEYDRTSCTSSGYFKSTSYTTACTGLDCLTQQPGAIDECHIRPEEEDDGDNAYYKWGNPETCGQYPYDLTLKEIVDCDNTSATKSYKSSYGNDNIKYTYRKGSSTYPKYAYYREAFKEKTNSDLGIACSSERTCWVACECQSGWSNGTAPSTGEYVWATDTRYAGGLSSMSANGSLSSMSANGNLSTMSDNYSISTMGSNGGMTCHKKICSSGYYLDRPSPTAFNYKEETGELGLTCYKATSCKDGYSSTGKGDKYKWHGMDCNRETIYYLCRISSQELTHQPENESSFECPGNTIVVSRYHNGDENKNSSLRCGTFAAYYQENGNVGTCRGERVYGVTITVEDAYWTEWRGERNSNFSAPSGYVIVGRAHSGDENGNTRYKVGRVYVSNGTTKKAVTMYDKSTYGPGRESCKDRDYSCRWKGMDGAYMMTGRRHDGDENGDTWTYHKRAKVDLY